jgi:hypothetical protein
MQRTEAATGMERSIGAEILLRDNQKAHVSSRAGGALNPGAIPPSPGAASNRSVSDSSTATAIGPPPEASAI